MRNPDTPFSTRHSHRRPSAGALNRLSPLMPLARTLAVAGAAALALAGCFGDSEQDLLKSAEDYLGRNDQKAAVIQLKTALQKNPQSGPARVLMGRALLDSGDLAGAVVELEKAAELKQPPDTVAPLLAQALLGQGQAQPVLERYGNLTLGSPAAQSKLLASVAQAQLATGKTSEGKTTVDRALQLADEAKAPNASALMLKAQLLASEGDMPQALQRAEAAAQADLRSPQPLLLKARLQLADGKGTPQTAERVAQAQTTLKALLQAHPAFVPAHALSITLHAQSRDTAAARQQFEALKKAAPRHPQTLLFDGQYALEDNQVPRAREIAQQLLKIGAEDPRVLRLAGLADVRAGYVSQALAHFGKAVTLEPQVALNRRLLAQAQLRTGQPALARDTLRPALAAATVDGETLAVAAQAELEAGNTAQAEKLYARAAAASPDDVRIKTAAAALKLGRGDGSEALLELESLAAVDKGPTADLALISARLQRRDADGALKAIQALQAKQADKPLPFLLEGRVHLLQQDAKAARTAFERALKNDAASMPAAASLAALDLADKQNDKARERFESVLKADSKNVQALMALVELSVREGKPDAEVQAAIERAVKAAPEAVEPRVALVDIQLRQKANAAALSAAQDAVARIPDRVELLDALGRAQIASGDKQQALSTYRKLVTLQPQNALLLVRQAEASLAAEDRTAARGALKKALEMQPELVAAQRMLVGLAVGEQRFDEAVSLSRQVQKQRAQEATGWLLEGDVELARGNFAAAATAFRGAQQRQASSIGAIRLHGALLRAGKGPEAEAMAARWEQEQPRDAAFQLHLGDVAATQLRWDTAERRYRKAMETQPRNPIVLNNLAYALVQLGKPEALALAQQANELAPKQPAFMDTLALALAGDRQIEPALELQRKALELSGGDPGLRLSLARILVQKGDKAQAKTELGTLAALGPKFARQDEVGRLLKDL